MINMEDEKFKICPKCNTNKNAAYKVMRSGDGSLYWYYNCTCGTAWSHKEGKPIKIDQNIPIPEKPKITDEQVTEINRKWAEEQKRI
jgi:DNA modification methylase